MRAAYYEALGGSEVLKIGERPAPVPSAEQVLIRNRAAGVGIWDVKEMRGEFGHKLPFPVIPGFEAAGVIEEAPADSGFRPGDEVFVELDFPGGGFAEYVTRAVDRVARKPATLSFAEAAGLVVAAGTAYEGLVDRGAVGAGETVLVTAASGGVGTSAVQIAKARGARVLAVASGPNHGLLRELGADATYDYHDASWVETVRRDIPEGVDVVFDAAGGQTRDQAVEAVRSGGRGIFIAGTPPRLAESIQVHDFSAEVTAARLDAISGLVERGALRPVLDSTYPLDEAAVAVARVGQGHSRGRVVLVIE